MALRGGVTTSVPVTLVARPADPSLMPVPQLQPTAASNLAQPLRYVVYDLWSTVAMGKISPVNPEWLTPTTSLGAVLIIIPVIIALVLGIVAVWSAWRLWTDIHSKRCRWQAKPGVLSMVVVGAWSLLVVVWIYYFYTWCLRLVFPIFSGHQK